MVNFRKIESALKKVKKYKTSAEKAAETKAHTKRMADMQLYLDLSSEKKNLLMDCLLNAFDPDTSKKILEKGVVIFVYRIESLESIEKDLQKAGIEFKSILSKHSAKKRGEIEDWFCSSPANKVVLIGEAGGQSLNLHATNEIILYNIPNGYGPFKQTIGRIARGFGKYDTYNIHTITILDSMDEYKQILISSKKELENELLTADSIKVKGVSTFNADVLKRIRKKLLWKAKNS